MEVYIITGITGFVGNVLAKKLLKENKTVIGLARTREKIEKVFTCDEVKRLTIIYGDITNKQDVEKLFKYIVGNIYVIHTAAKVSIEDKKITKELYNINVQGTINICDIALQNHVQKFIYVSSTDALNSFETKSIKEPIDYKPNLIRGGYGKSKAIASEYVLNKIKQDNLPGIIIHPSAIIGAGDYSNTHMTQLICDFLRKKLPCSIKGTYNFIDVDDLTEVLLKLLKSNKKNIYIVSGYDMSITDFINTVADYKNMKKIKNVPVFLAYIGLPFVKVYCLLRHIRPLYTSYALQTVKKKCCFDNSRLKIEFNFQNTPLNESIKKHVDFIVEKIIS